MKNFIILSVALFFTVNFINAQDWKTYPYQQQGSLVYFPQDEGHHPEEPTEWWYLTGQVVGETTGKEYSFMLSYFYYPYVGFDGFRIFNLSNETDKLFYPETLPIVYSIMAEDSLHIKTTPPGSVPEEWLNLTNENGEMLPFEYSVNAMQENGSINILLDTYKRPLMIADSGFLNQGIQNYTYYYSLTGLHVSGEITIDGVTENIAGSGWMDHQYGDFNPYTGEKYEWFSVQLSNGIDMNLWNIFTIGNTIPDTSTYRECSIYFNGTQDTAVSDFQLERLAYEFMPDSGACYSQKWHFLWNDIDLLITTNSSSNEINIPIRFFEGTTSIEGTVGGNRVTGIGFAELLHSYEIPQVNFISPDSGAIWIGDFIDPIIWECTNPDEGNPLYFDLYFSDDGGENYNLIAAHIQEEMYSWDYSGFPDDYYIFKVTAYSVDTTLIATYVSDSVFIDDQTGLGELTGKNQITIFPNPTAGIFEIQSKCEVEKIEILNVQGELVYSQDLSNLAVAVNLSKQASGNYFIKIFTSEGIFIRKLVLKK